MSDDITLRIADIYVKWNKLEISGNEAMIQIGRLVKKECDKIWLTDQGTKAK